MQQHFKVILRFNSLKVSVVPLMGVKAVVHLTVIAYMPHDDLNHYVILFVELQKCSHARRICKIQAKLSSKQEL